LYQKVSKLAAKSGPPAMRWGAYPEDWQTAILAGWGADLLPVVCNPGAKISRASSLKALGKMPSQYNETRDVVGVLKWPEKIATDQEIDDWSRKMDYGIGVNCRNVRAIDVDIENAEIGDEIFEFIRRKLAKPFVVRRRAGTARFLIPLAIPGILKKEVIQTQAGNIEFLANGQMFVAFGTHVASGGRYMWDATKNFVVPEISVDHAKEILTALATKFSHKMPIDIEGINRQEQHQKAINNDETAQFLIDHDFVISTGRDGSLNIRCPFADGHSVESGDSATRYFIAHTNGYANGHFKCMHSSCKGRSDTDFRDACGYSKTLIEKFDILLPERSLPKEPDILFAITAPPAHRSEEQAAGVTASLKVMKSGEVRNILMNNVRVIGQPELIKCRLVFDAFKDAILIRWDGDSQLRFLTENDITLIREILETAYNFTTTSHDMVRDAVGLIARKNTVDSAKEWLNRQKWDGVPRVKTFISKYMNVPASEYSEAVAMYMWTAAAQRILNPGCKADMVPVFIGEQGAKKSTSILSLAPSEDTFAEIRLDKDDDALSRIMKGKLVVELAELRGLASREAEGIKSWISKRNENWVPKYEEFAVSYPRRIMIYGTGNKKEFLADETGERRWLPIMCGDVRDDEIIRDREQLWAEGRELSAVCGIKWQEAERLSMGEHPDYKITDPWVDIISGFMKMHNPHTGMLYGDGYVTVRDILERGFQVKLQFIDRKKEHRVTRCLHAIGYEPMRGRDQHGNQERGWRKKRGS
jgi:predicted P-loop ATPase